MNVAQFTISQAKQHLLTWLPVTSARKIGLDSLLVGDNGLHVAFL